MVINSSEQNRTTKITYVLQRFKLYTILFTLPTSVFLVFYCLCNLFFRAVQKLDCLVTSKFFLSLPILELNNFRSNERI